MTDQPKIPSVAEMKRRGMSPQEILETWRRRPISSRVGSRALRRKVVTAMYGSWLLLALSEELGFPAQNKWFAAGGGVLAVCAVVIATLSAVWLGRRTYVNSPDLEDRELDERLVQIRNQAYRRAFQVFSVVVVVAWPVSLLLFSNVPGNIGFDRGLLLYASAVLLATTLPTAIVAWREPDPVELD